VVGQVIDRVGASARGDAACPGEVVFGPGGRAVGVVGQGCGAGFPDLTAGRCGQSGHAPGGFGERDCRVYRDTASLAMPERCKASD